MKTWIGCAVAMTLCLVPAPAVAQQGPSAGDSPARLYAALQEIEGTAALDSVERVMSGSRGGSATPVELTRRGLLNLRRHELTGELSHAQRAFDAFTEAARRDTTAAWAFFGLGAVIDARPAVLFATPGVLNDLLPPRRVAGALGLEPRSRSQQALLRALELEPALAPAALIISEMAVVSMDDAELEIAARALGRVVESGDAAPEVLLALSRVRNLMADASAANSAARLAATLGADRGLALLSSASALLPSRVTERRGAQSYLEGTLHLSPESARRYYDDIQPVLSPRDRREWASLSLEEKGAWLRDYWDVRAALSGGTVAGMLGRHYRRVVRSERMMGGEFERVTPVEEMLGTGERFPYTVAGEFADDLDYFYDFYEFKGEGDRTALTVALVIPTDQLQPLLADSSVVYGVRISAMVVDSITREVSRVDTMQYYRSPRLVRPESYLRTYVQLPVRPSENTVYRLVVRDAAEPRTGDLFGGSVDLRSFRGPDVELSDLVVTVGEGGRWSRGELILPLTPATAFTPGEPLTLFYEIYHLAPDTPYRTDIRIEPGEGGLMDRLLDVVRPGTRSLELSFEGRTAPDATGAVQEVRTLTSELRPGEYRLTIRVTDLSTGESAESSRQLTLEEEE